GISATVRLFLRRLWLCLVLRLLRRRRLHRQLHTLRGFARHERRLLRPWRLIANETLEVHRGRDLLRHAPRLIRHRVVTSRAKRLRELESRCDVEVWDADRWLIDPVARTNNRLRSNEIVVPQ